LRAPSARSSSFAPVDLRKRIGPAADLDNALQDGEIDGHVAYTGTVLSVVAGEEVSGLDPDETYRQVKAFYDGRARQ
jgi:osmoprotectant transport system substrate-binding protein